MNWELVEGIALARKVEAEVESLQLHVSLGGSVLHKGCSNKDLDILVYPRSSKSIPARVNVIAKLEGAGFSEVKQRDHKEYDDKVVYSANWLGKRVDFFFLFEAFRE